MQFTHCNLVRSLVYRNLVHYLGAQPVLCNLPYQQLKKVYYSVGKLIKLKPQEQLTFVLEKAKTKIFKRNKDLYVQLIKAQTFLQIIK